MENISIAEPFKTQNASNIECVNFSKIYNSKNTIKIKKAQKLLLATHSGIYLTHFPLKSEQEPIDVWINTLKLGDKKSKHIYITFGEDLDTSHPQIMGFVAAGLYGTSGLIEYIIRTKEAATKLRGTEIVNKAIEELNKLNNKMNGKNIDFLYWELNNPQKIAYNEQHPNYMFDCMSPQKRINLIKKNYNGKLIGFDYVQPPLTKSQKTCDTLVLARIEIIQPDINKNIEQLNQQEAKSLKSYLINFIEVLTQTSAEEVAKQDYKIKNMLDQVDIMIKYNISPLEEYQTLQQKRLLKREK